MQVEIEIAPCKENCAILEGDVNYEEEITNFSYSYGFYVNIVDSSTSFEKYDDPISRGIGASLEIALSPQYVRKSIVAEQIVVQTVDGWLIRSKREDINLQFKHITHAGRPREPGGPFALVVFEIADTVFLVERVYPNLIQLLSDFGGLVQVCFFISFSVIVIHHNIMIDQYLLNDAILQKDERLQEEELKDSASEDQ